jgi:HD-like signal output (HDOD) protein
MQTWGNLPPNVQDRWTDIIRRIPLPPISFGKVAFTALEKIEPDEWLRVISADPLLCAKLLIVANSAAMGLITPITSMKRAIVHLGGAMVRIIVLGYYIEGLLARWDHYPRNHFAFIRSWSSCAAAIAHSFAKETQLADPETLATAALLSRVGSLLPGLAWPGPGQEYARLPNELARVEYELNTWQISSPVLSEQLLQSWDFPMNLQQFVARHLAALAQVLEPAEESKELTVLATSIVLGASYVQNQDTDIADVLSMDCNNTLLINIHNFDFLDKLSSVWTNPRVQNDLSTLAG